MMTRWITTFVILLTGSLSFPVNSILAEEKETPGSVTFIFDGGTLQCTFGKTKLEQTPHVAMIVFPASVEAFSKRNGITIDKKLNGSFVLISDGKGKFVQLTNESLSAWSKARVSDMAGRKTSVAENAFVAAVVQTVSTDTPIELWASQAQEALESGHWSKLFAPKLDKRTPVEGDPFK